MSKWHGLLGSTKGRIMKRQTSQITLRRSGNRSSEHRRTFTISTLSRAREDSSRLIAELHAGLPATEFEALQRRMDLTAKELTEVTRIAQRTITRRKKEGRLSTDESERLLRIGLLFERARDVLESDESARRWMRTPNRALGGKTPLQYADTEPGAREVEDVLGRIEHGVFS
jgi:putative toxin-antitoxin system antitoxin component (TIGR02293 family)